jgi:NAD(P)H-hydrate epimerase
MQDFKIPAITTDQMREVDRLMVETYHIELTQMMENAGRNLATLARQRFLSGNSTGKRVLVLAGRGGNGGGGLVAARRLHNWGADVQVFTTQPDEEIHGVPAHQLGILRHMGVPVTTGSYLDGLPEAELILDALIGYGLQRAPRGVPARLIEMANAWSSRGVPILSLDVPSGMDATTGEIHEPCIRAAATLTLALPKTGLVIESAKLVVGTLFLADIGVPPALYGLLGVQVPPIFNEQEIIQII